MKKKIEKEIRTKWINALESGRYKQTVSELHSASGKNCCLGVLGRILRCDINDLKSNGMPAELDFKNASKFPTCLVKTNKTDKISRNTKFAHKLATLNDRGKNFKEIAAYIRSNTIGV